MTWLPTCPRCDELSAVDALTCEVCGARLTFSKFGRPEPQAQAEVLAQPHPPVSQADQNEPASGLPSEGTGSPRTLSPRAPNPAVAAEPSQAAAGTAHRVKGIW